MGFMVSDIEGAGYALGKPPFFALATGREKPIGFPPNPCIGATEINDNK